MDIRPPRPKLSVPKREDDTRANPASADLPRPTNPGTAPRPSKPLVESVDMGSMQKLKLTKATGLKLRHVLVGSVIALVTGIVGFMLWYSYALTPRSSEGAQIRFAVQQGETASDIAKNLHKHGIIRSELAFVMYTQLTGTRSKLQAGGYVLSANQDVKSIVQHIVEGKTDEYGITIPPGLTLKELEKVFLKNGFSEEEISKAFNTSYDHPLLATRPQGASLEGYIFPETYKMGADQSLEALLTRSFDQLYKTLSEKKYLEEYAKRGLSIHQAVTLASIVQKEVSSPVDQKQVAQVFLKRMADGIQLGSDVTFMYAAKKMGVPATVDLDSPYNTRKYAGLPPGPIANMNPSALEAVAFPSPGDYLYFVAGDDGTTYYALTEDQHNANVAAHCTTLCQ
jgi:UPF0755 protein